MNYQQEYTKSRLSGDGPFLSEFSLKEIGRAKSVPMIVTTRGEQSLIKGVPVQLERSGRRLIADKVTGSLYEPDSGACLSSSFRRLVGPAPEGYELPPKPEAFSFGTQPIDTKPKRRSKLKAPPGAVRNENGKVCGSSKHGAKLTEEIVKLIRQHKPGSSTIYLLTAKQARERYGIAEKTVSDIRCRRSWRHLP